MLGEWKDEVLESKSGRTLQVKIALPNPLPMEAVPFILYLNTERDIKQDKLLSTLSALTSAGFGLVWITATELNLLEETVAWLKSQSERLHLHPQKIGVIGDRNSGSLPLHLALSSKLQGIITFSSPTLFSEIQFPEQLPPFLLLHGHLQFESIHSTILSFFQTQLVEEVRLFEPISAIAPEKEERPRLRLTPYSTWIDAAVNDFQQKGGFENLPGKGKKLDLESGDVFSNILKNANALPPWIQLQHDIRDNIAKLIKLKESSSSKMLKEKVKEINKQIEQYNYQVPTHILQKPKIQLESVEEVYERWL